MNTMKAAIVAGLGLDLPGWGYLLDLIGRKQRAEQFAALGWALTCLIDAARLPGEDIRLVLVSLLAGTAQRTSTPLETVQAELASCWKAVTKAMGIPTPDRNRAGEMEAACSCCGHPLGQWPKEGDALTCPFCATAVRFEVVTSKFSDASPATPQGGTSL